MVRLERTRFSDGSKNAVLDIQVSTASDLPALGASVCGFTLLAGSIAQIIQTGAFATLDDDGSWYDTDGNEVN